MHKADDKDKDKDKVDLESWLPALPRFPKLPPLPGKPKVIPPDVLTIIYLDEIAGRLADLQETVEGIKKSVKEIEKQMPKVPEMRMRPFEKTITGSEPTVWEVMEDVGRKCTCASIFSDGPSDCFVALNNPDDGFQKVSEGETLDFDFHGEPTIERFIFKSIAGGTANLRIPVEY